MTTNLLPLETIEQRILLLRSQKVLLDADLAALYGVETKVLLHAIKRNAERFPEDFMFQLNDDEWTALRSQSVTSNKKACGSRWSALCALCLYRARCCHAVIGTQ